LGIVAGKHHFHGPSEQKKESAAHGKSWQKCVGGPLDQQRKVLMSKKFNAAKLETLGVQ